MVRASELTIEERLPPRVIIREHSPLELPHILVLIDDGGSRVIEPLAESPGRKLYQTELMKGGGTVEGYALGEEQIEGGLLPALESLADDASSFLYAAGDGNHSLAAAKQVWESRKRTGAPMDHPSRWALVELVNLYTPGLRFEPIHRLIAGPGTEEFHSRLAAATDEIADSTADFADAGSPEHPGTAAGTVRYVSNNGTANYSLAGVEELPVAFVDSLLAEVKQVSIDYIHGAEEAVRLAADSAGAALLLPPIDRSLLFSTVERRGALPRKAFSLGHSEEKRYYMEARRIE